MKDTNRYLIKTNSVMRVSVYLALSFVLLSVLPTRAFAWGWKGHLIITQIAQEQLSEKARQRVSELLNGATLDSVATYADDIRRYRPETERWHYVNIPRDKSDYDPMRDCKCTRRGDCIIAAIEQFQIILADTNERPYRRAEALKFIVHFVGDLHQPMHCIDDNDRGGNEVLVTFFGVPSNLHKVWDIDLIERTGLSSADYAKQLEAALASQTLVVSQSGTVADWALETHKVAVAHAYKIPANKQLEDEYFLSNRPVVEAQLAKAGVRLARILNEVLQ